MSSFTDFAELGQQITHRYPREIVHNRRLPLTLTPMVPSDWQMLLDLVRDIPDEDRKFFRHDLSDPARVQRWCEQLDYSHRLPVLAWHRDRIVADAVLEREPGLWTSHVGRVRLMVHPEFRGIGIGRFMLDEVKTIAKQLELHKLVAESAAEQTKLISALEHCDFREVARLPEYIRDQNGYLHDLVIMLYDLK